MSDLIKMRKEEDLFMNRLLNTLKSGTAIAMCLTIAFEPISRAWASGNGQNMQGLNDKDEENNTVARQKNPSKEKEKGAEKPQEKVIQPITDTHHQENLIEEIPWDRQIQCHWHLGDTTDNEVARDTYKKVALNILAEKAVAGDRKASLKYLKKLGTLGTLEFFLNENGKIFLPANIHSEQELKKSILTFLNKLYEQFIFFENGETPESKFQILRAKYYYQKLLDAENPLKAPILEEVKSGLRKLTHIPEGISETLIMKLRYLNHLISKGNSHDLNKAKNAWEFAAAVFELAEETKKAMKISKIEHEVVKLTKFAATLYRKSAESLTLSSTSAGVQKTYDRKRSFKYFGICAC